MSLLTGSPRSATVIAEKKPKFCKLKREALKPILKQTDAG